MAYANNMEKLLRKIERRLGTRPLNLPEHLSVTNWAEVIIDESLDTFSRYFPNKILYNVSTSYKDQNGYYLIDEDFIPGDVTILGVRDLSFEKLAQSLNSLSHLSSYGHTDYYNATYSVEDLMMTQMAADHSSMFNRGMFVEFEYPNRIKVTNSTGNDIMSMMHEFPVELLIKHSDNLATLSPTMMETFEQLALCDVAAFLYNELKYYDNLETVFGNVNIRLDDIREKAERREDLVNKLEENYVTAANKNQPMIWCE